MQYLAIPIGYLIGALPMGYLYLLLFKRQDITQIGSGRTGGTNAMRAGGFGLGLLTGLSDIAKGYLAVALAYWLAPDNIWLQVLSGVAAVAGHNWSLWLYWWTGKLSAGAGTGPNVGAAMFFWPVLFWIEAPLVAFVVLVIGYASLASIAAAVGLILIFTLRYFQLGEPVELIYYGIMTSGLVMWALRSNIQRLLKGEERRVGVFARKKSP